MIPRHSSAHRFLRQATWLVCLILVVVLLSCDLPSQLIGAAGTATIMPTSIMPASTSTATPAFPGGGTGRIAFVSNREGNDEIYVMNADGTQAMNLSNNPASDTYPTWSPDGARIAFISNRDGKNEIYVMNANGAYQTRLTNHWATNEYPAWSPDGTRIAFTSKRDGDYEIYVMNSDGTNVTRLTDSPTPNDQPDWSPDGKQIVFVSERDGNKEIYVMYADGSQPTRLTNNTAIDWFPKWSPDGKRIGFVSYRDGNLEIYVMNADGSQPTRLTQTKVRNFPPAWSPDGSLIAFNSERDGNFEIYFMKADGSMQTRLTSHTASDMLPVWQPKEPSVDAVKTPWVARVTGVPSPTPTLTPTPAPTAPYPIEVLTPTVNISGTWDSNQGLVTLQLWKSDANKLILVTGYWVAGNNRGAFTSGTFDPQSGILEAQYYQPWNKVEGTAKLTLAPDGKTLKGIWKQGDQIGDWTMTRSLGAAPTTIAVSAATTTQTIVPKTTVPPSVTHPAPTATATVPPIAPGLYADAIKTDPSEPKSNQNIAFRVTFLNTANGTINQKWFVKIFEPDKKNSFGETAKVSSAIPVGTGVFSTGNEWRTRVGVCTTYIARVFWVDAANTIYEMTKSDGNSTATNFTICP